MDLIRWRDGLADPFMEFESLQEEVNKLFEDFRAPEPRGLFESTYSPAVDVLENDDRFEVICDVPGIDSKDIETSISGNVLTIKGERKGYDHDGAADRPLRADTRIGRFQRTIQLPLPVNASRVEAVLKDGVLRVILPKAEELKPRQIAVKAS
jgi:HSP20 family protein